MTELSARLEVPGLVDSPRRLDISQSIERSTFEALCTEVLERVGLDPKDMTDVVVTGECSRIPMIRAGASRFFDPGASGRGCGARGRAQGRPAGNPAVRTLPRF